MLKYYTQSGSFGEYRESIECNDIIKHTLLNGIKVPHSTSLPVIRKKNGGYCLAAFAFFFSKEDLDINKIDRPTKWCEADIVMGDIIERYDSEKNDFSDAPYYQKYDITPDEKKHDTSREYYVKAFDYLDYTRKEIIERGGYTKDVYNKYLYMILKNIPESYRRFYTDLSV